MTLRPQFSLGVAGRDDRGSAAHPAGGRRGLQAQFPGLGGDQVGDLMGLEVVPHILHRVQLRRIGRQSLHHQASPGAGQVVLDQEAAMDRRPIPQDEDLARHMPLQMLEELDPLGAFDAAGVDLEIEAPERQAAHDGKAFPVEALVQHGRLSAQGPGARAGRTSTQSTFVDKDKSAALLAGLFFKAGPRTRFSAQWPVRHARGPDVPGAGN